MQINKFILPQDIYSAHLETVNNIRLTRREVDIIAYLFSGRSAKIISSLLSVAPKTIEAHMRNIMMKLECNSRDGVIDFIEKSDKFVFVKRYYLSLVAQEAFKKSLKKISEIIVPEESTCLLIHWREETYQPSILDSLEGHLKLAGINVSTDAKEGRVICDPSIDINNTRANRILYLVTEALLDYQNEKDSHVLRKISENPRCRLVLFPSAERGENSCKELFDIKCTDISKKDNYYIFVFSILKVLLPKIDLDKIIYEFKTYYNALYDSFEPVPPAPPPTSNLDLLAQSQSYADGFLSRFKRKKSRVIVESALGLSALFLIFLLFTKDKQGELGQHKAKQIASATRSDLIVPMGAVFLDRPHVIAKMDEGFQGPQDIKTVALVGIGGAGKTTIARRYARDQGASVVWEFNAETKESLNNSFENLANVLSKTESERKKFKEIKDIKDTQEREKEVIGLIKDKLRYVSDWVLIYDNVADFTNFQSYFPHDPSVWGKGKVIILTRDNNIENNNNVNKTIKMGELTPEEKLTLFTKIMANGNADKVSPFSVEQANQFLNDIPPFPLDVSVAAYYLKTTNIPYNKYLEHLKKNSSGFTTTQENVLKEATNYAKTRYNIIALSIKELLSTHKDFEALLLLVGLLDHQNIPRDLLNVCKSDVVVENFIYNLKKYSFITNEASFHSLPTFSIHQSTQEISLRYLTKALSLQKNSPLLQEIVSILEAHIAEAIDKEDYLKLKLLVSHCEKLLSCKDLLTETIKRSIGGELGYIYFYLGDYKKSRKIIEESLQGLDKDDSKSHARIAHVLVHLGDVYRDFGEYEKAKNLLEKSLVIYKKHFDKNYIGIAPALVYLGNVYRRLGNYDKAKSLLEESLIIYRKHFDINHPGTARALATLANIYRSLANYRKAKELFNESLTIYKKHFPGNHPRVGWTLAHLGNVHREIGDYKQAKDLIEHSLAIYKKHFSENHVKVGWVLSLLGDIYRKLGDYEKAKSLFEQAFVVFKNNFPENDSKIAHALMDLGSVYGSLGNTEKAKSLLEKSLTIYKERFPEKLDEIARASVYLANVRMETGHYEAAQALLRQSREIYEKNYDKSHNDFAYILKSLGRAYLLEGHIKIAEDHFREALDILQKNQHPSIYAVLEDLAELFLKKHSLETKQENFNQPQNLKVQAHTYLTQALKIVKNHFPKDSPHVFRIQNKIKKISSVMGEMRGSAKKLCAA